MSYQLQKAHPQDVPVIFEMILEIIIDYRYIHSYS